MRRSEFQGRLTLLSEATNKQLTPILSDLWWGKYGGLPDARLDRAFGVALDRCKFFPSPAEFNEILAQLAEADGEVVTGETAWARVMRDIIAPFPAHAGAGWPDELSRTLVYELFGLPYNLAHTEGDYALRRAQDRFVGEYDRRRAAADAALPAPTLRAIGGGR